MVSAPETQPCVPYFLSSYITVPVADTLVLLADIGLDILQLLVDTMGYDTFAYRFTGFGLSLGEIDILQL